MTTEAKRLYLEKVRTHYKKASKKAKGLILDEFCEVYGCSRGHAIRMLNDESGKRPDRRGRKSGLHGRNGVSLGPLLENDQPSVLCPSCKS